MPFSSASTDVAPRATEAVPFLGFDTDAYAAIVDGNPYWIWYAYTTSDAYPYSQSIVEGQATGNPEQSLDLNYNRNYVKVVIDAYKGSVTYYADLSEPMSSMALTATDWRVSGSSDIVRPR